MKGPPGGFKPNFAKDGKPPKKHASSSSKEKEKGSSKDKKGKGLAIGLTKFDPSAPSKGKSGGKQQAQGKKPPRDKNVIHGIKLGSKFQKHFDGHGTFVGTVVSYSKEKKFFSVKYSDGDTEELATDTLRGLMGMPPRNQK